MIKILTHLCPDNLVDGLTCLDVKDVKYILLKNASGIHAFSALCPHVAGPMDRAEVNGNIVTCPLHGWQFDLDRDGLEINGYSSLKVYTVETSSGHITLSDEI